MAGSGSESGQPVDLVAGLAQPLDAISIIGAAVDESHRTRPTRQARWRVLVFERRPGKAMIVTANAKVQARLEPRPAGGIGKQFEGGLDALPLVPVEICGPEPIAERRVLDRIGVVDHRQHTAEAGFRQLVDHRADFGERIVKADQDIELAPGRDPASHRARLKTGMPSRTSSSPAPASIKASVFTPCAARVRATERPAPPAP